VSIIERVPSLGALCDKTLMFVQQTLAQCEHDSEKWYSYWLQARLSRKGEPRVSGEVVSGVVVVVVCVSE
jgi:hypothetical protein